MGQNWESRYYLSFKIDFFHTDVRKLPDQREVMEVDDHNKRVANIIKELKEKAEKNGQDIDKFISDISSLKITADDVENLREIGLDEYITAKKSEVQKKKRKYCLNWHMIIMNSMK